MPAKERPEIELDNAVREALEQRSRFINETCDRLHEALIGPDDNPLTMQAALGAAIGLLSCGLIALNEIALAQQQIAKLATMDYQETVAAMVKDEAARMRAADKEAETKRNYIGKRP